MNRDLVWLLLCMFGLLLGCVLGCLGERRKRKPPIARLSTTYLRVVGITLGVITMALFFGAMRMRTTILAKANFPFRVSYRMALTGPGYVVQIRNIWDRIQSVRMTLSNPTLNSTKKYSLVVPPWQVKEIGYLQGWTGSSGDKITLECNGDTEEFKIP